MRLASYNIEWMNGLFDKGELQLDASRSARENANKRQQGEAIAEVLRAIDADVFLILEAPNQQEDAPTTTALENFAKEFRLRQNRALMGHASNTDQEIALLYDPKIIKARYEAFSHDDAPAFSEKFYIDLPGPDEDGYEFSKPPLETQIIERASNFAFRLIGVHMKSKAPHGARNKVEVEQAALVNRRKQAAQATWLRKRIDHMHFPFIVAGDFNDGPGMDDYEKKLGLSAVDILTEGGKLYDPSLETNNRHMLTTSRFYNYNDQSFTEALLDYIFVSKEMHPFAQKWRIWHPLHDPEICEDANLQDALLKASDHFPVSLDLAFPSSDD